ncbi:MAG: hypothetical protein HZB55_22915 [Deltaproteobacteria bacterium]|nr:hypothetical protein [Deltaproteobacteria bacterium]
MERGEAGRFEAATVGGKPVLAFVLALLPPAPPLVLAGLLQPALKAAVLAVGRPDDVGERIAALPLDEIGSLPGELGRAP